MLNVQHIWYYLKRKIEGRSQIYEMKAVAGFVENLYGLQIANNTSGTCVFRISPILTGNYKFVLGYTSTVAPYTFAGNIRIGSWRFEEAFQDERYLPLTTFSQSETELKIPKKYSTTSFNITTINEVLIIRIVKNAGTEAGNLYILAGILLKV